MFLVKNIKGILKRMNEISVIELIVHTLYFILSLLTSYMVHEAQYVHI